MLCKQKPVKALARVYKSIESTFVNEDTYSGGDVKQMMYDLLKEQSDLLPQL